MKMALSFIAGIAACCLILFGVKAATPALAETTEVSDNITEAEETGFSLAELLPDIEKIYRESLTLPFVKAQGKIYDPDIADFYQELMDRTVLYDPLQDASADTPAE